MGRLLYIIMQFFSKGFLKNILLGAGVSVISASFFLIIINYIMDKFIDVLPASGDIINLLGIAGMHHAISVIFSAFVAKATINSLSPILSKGQS